MKKIVATTMTCSMLAGISLSGCSLFFGKKREDPTVVPFSTISSSAHRRFVKNWDEKEQPVLCALIRSRSEWDYWFQPAAVMRQKNALAPSSDYFDTRQLMLATRVIQAPDSAERGQIFTADRVTKRDGVLKLEYRFVKPASDATYRMKDFLLVEIPKDRYTTGPVLFVENGQTVCQINR